MNEHCDIQVMLVVRISTGTSVVLAEVLWFFSVPVGLHRVSTSIRRRPIPSKSIQVHHLSITLPLDGISSATLTTSENNRSKAADKNIKH
jgi:hypothetical protein